MTEQIIPTNFRIPKRHRKHEFALYGPGFMCVIQVESERALKFSEGCNSATYKERPRDRSLILDWMQESVDYLRAICQK